MILVDNSEPLSIINLLQQSVPVAIMPLNHTHRSDYYFGGADCKTRQFSRKQAGELLGNMDEAEDQLRDYYNNADENNQIVEGIISSVPLTKKRHKGVTEISVRGHHKPNALFSYKIAENGYIYDEHVWDVSAAMLHAWVYRLYQAGIQTFYTENFIGTARLLAAIYHNCQKPPEEHDTLQRVVRPRVVIRERNPFIESLMSISIAYKLGIGEDRATKIATRYSTFSELIRASLDDLRSIDGIGMKTAESLLRALWEEK